MLNNNASTTLKAKDPRLLHVVGEVEAGTGGVLRVRVPYDNGQVRFLGMDELLNDCPNLKVLILQSPISPEATRSASILFTMSLTRVFASQIAQTVPVVLVLPPLSAKLSQAVLALYGNSLTGLLRQSWLWRLTLLLLSGQLGILQGTVRRFLESVLTRGQMIQVLDGISKARAEIYGAVVPAPEDKTQTQAALDTALDVCLYSHAHLFNPQRVKANLE